MPVPVVVVDPGHNRIANPALEPIGPGASVRKIMDGGGARGVVSGVPEADVTLAVALRLRVILRRAGVSVVMTRTTTEGVSMGNVARARIANRARAQLFVRVHADGADAASVHGDAHALPGASARMDGRHLRGQQARRGAAPA